MVQLCRLRFYSSNKAREMIVLLLSFYRDDIEIQEDLVNCRCLRVIEFRAWSYTEFSSVQFSCSVVSYCLRPLTLTQHQGLFKWVSSLHQVIKVLGFQLQHQSLLWTPRTDFLQDELVGSPCSPRDSQESSPTPQLKSINSSALSFLYSPTLTSIHNYWKNHSLD